MAKAIDVAKYLVIRATKEEEDFLTPLKLQKLCYYSLGVFSKLNNGKKLFSEKVEAWPHGPVVRDVYDYFSGINANSTSLMLTKESINNEDYSDLKLTEDEKFAVEETFKLFFQYTAGTLRNMTHEESPWKNNYQENRKNIIPFDDIRAFFDKALKVN